MRILVTGAAGFIGFHAVRALIQGGHDVLGVDNLTPYYDPALKRERLGLLAGPSFRFAELDIADCAALVQTAGRDVDAILHLAAQAGVRHSIENPFAYQRSNLAGHLAVLEYARSLPRLRHLVYASSSSVYGDRGEGPFKEEDRCDAPASLYAATKRSAELMSEAYARLYGIAQTGLRFFTIYGPFGRPDMAYWSFTQRILHDRPIVLFNGGAMERDFTFVGDVSPVLPKIVESPPEGSPPHAIYNLGHHEPVTLRRFVAAIEAAVGRSARIETAPMQKGDVAATFADISKAQRDFGFSPTTSIESGIAAFVAWGRERLEKD